MKALVLVRLIKEYHMNNLEVLQNINDWCITKEIRNYVVKPIYLYQLSPLEIEWSSEKLTHGKLLLSFVWSYLPTSMEAWVDLNKDNLAQLSKASLTREDLAVVHLITNALNININKAKGDKKMTVNNEELEQPTAPKQEPQKAVEKKTVDKVSYEFPKEFYDAHKEVINAYLDNAKKPIKHTWKESKNKKTPGAWILTIKASDQRRFQTVMNLKKIKTKDYLKK